MENMASWWCPADLQAVGGLREQDQAGRGASSCCSYPVAQAMWNLIQCEILQNGGAHSQKVLHHDLCPALPNPKQCPC